MTLKLRLEGPLLRSVLDVPGVVCLSDQGGAQRFVIDQKWEPTQAGLDQLEQMRAAGAVMGVAPDINVINDAPPPADAEDDDADALPAWQHEVDLDEMVEGCVGEDELRALVMFAMQGVLTATQLYVPKAAFETVIAAAEHARDTRDAVMARMAAEGRIPPVGDD